MPTIALWGALAGKYRGPILVIAGGPSVSIDLPRLNAQPRAVITANAHGFKQALFTPTHALVLDDWHSVTHESMEALVRPHGVPIIGPHWWADYRMNDWNGGINSGLAAICAAILMGGEPVIVTGIDGFAGGYFHDPSAPRLECQGEKKFRDQVRKLVALTAGCPVRPMSGPLLDHFPRLDHAEQFAPVRYKGIEIEWDKPRWISEAIDAQPVTMVSIRRPRFVFQVAKVPAGKRLVMSEAEARDLERQRYAVRRDFAVEPA